MARQLSVYFDDKLTGTLLQDDTGRLRFHYAPSYLRPGSVPLSISMPLSDQEYEDNRARPFFSNLLPDGLARQRVAKLLGVSEKNPFALLEIIGGECAGAFSLYPEGTVPSLKNDQDYTFLTDFGSFVKTALARRDKGCTYVLGRCPG